MCVCVSGILAHTERERQRETDRQRERERERERERHTSQYSVTKRVMKHGTSPRKTTKTNSAFRFVRSLK
jgi:hypothetical protein